MIRVYNTIWLVNSSVYFYPISLQREISNHKNSDVRKKSEMSTNHCARTYFWWVCACAPQLWFMNLPNWHFSLHLTPHKLPVMCTVGNFQQLIFGSLLKSSEENCITQINIYVYVYIAQHLRSQWSAGSWL